MRFLIDAQLPPTLADWLKRMGQDASHALHYRQGRMTDVELHQVAIDEDRILISKDEDFFHLATRPGDRLRLIWLRMGNCRTRPLLTALEKVWPFIEAEFQNGQRILEIR